MVLPFLCSSPYHCAYCITHSRTVHSLRGVCAVSNETLRTDTRTNEKNKSLYSYFCSVTFAKKDWLPLREKVGHKTQAVNELRMIYRGDLQSGVAFNAQKQLVDHRYHIQDLINYFETAVLSICFPTAFLSSTICVLLLSRDHRPITRDLTSHVIK